MARPRDIRFVVTNLDHGSPEWLYDNVYCARGQAENLIKLHKTQLASERTSRHRQSYRRLLVDAAVRAAVFDGFSIGSNDLTQLKLGVDRDSEIVAFDSTSVIPECGLAILMLNPLTIARRLLAPTS